MNFTKTGTEHFLEVIQYMKDMGFDFRDKQPNYVNEKYWPLKGGSSIQVRDDHYNVYCNEFDGKNVEEALDVKHSYNDDGARPYGFKNLSEEDILVVIECLSLNPKNMNGYMVIDEDAELRSSWDGKRLNEISTKSSVSFKYNYEVMNACFGSSFSTFFRNATKPANDGCRVWFPKAAYKVGGKWEPGSKSVNWKNTFENAENTKLAMWLYDGEDSKEGKEPELVDSYTPSYCFMSDPNNKEGYSYRGTFLVDNNASTLRYRLFRMVNNKIDLTPWQKGIDYVEPELELNYNGFSALRNYYIDKNYKKHKNALNEFSLSDEQETEKKEYSTAVNIFNEKYLPASFARDESIFTNEYLPNLCKYINLLFGRSYTAIEIESICESKYDLLKAIIDIITVNVHEHNSIIRNSILGQDLASCIMALYHKKFFLYSLSENETEYYINMMGLKCQDDDDLTEKHCLLYFWKQIAESLEVDYMDAFDFYCFVIGQFGIFEKSPIKLREIIAVSEDVKEEYEIEEYFEKLEQNENPVDIPSEFTYLEVPQEKVLVDQSSVARKTIPRDAKKRMNALVHADFKCEVDANHKSFISRTTGRAYMETHHLIPVENHESFEYSLDVEENIVCLCSNCHNQVHYGANAKAIVKKLYMERKSLLEKVGLDITESQLLSLYKGEETEFDKI